MTEQQTEQEAVEPSTEREAEEEQTPPQSDHEEQIKSLRAEARGYRQKMGEAKRHGERMETLAENYVRQAAERVASDRLSRPSLLWQVGGVRPMDLLDEEGQIDTERLESAVTATLETIPEARPRAHHGDLGPRGTAATRQGRSFGDVLKGGGR